MYYDWLTRELRQRFMGAHLVHLEPFKETSHVLFLHMGPKLTASGFLNRHILVAVALEFSVHSFSLALPSEVPGQLTRFSGNR